MRVKFQHAPYILSTVIEFVIPNMIKTLKPIFTSLFKYFGISLNGGEIMTRLKVCIFVVLRPTSITVL